VVSVKTRTPPWRVLILTTMRLALALGGIALLIAGCQKAADHDADTDGSIGNGSDAAVAGDFTMLVSRSWTVPPNTETYKCVRVQVPTDMWITAFRALSPVGTHHSVLTVSTNSTQVGDYDCSAGQLDSEMLYAAGVNTDDNEFPAGVAIHVVAGTYVNLNLHLFNTTDNPITDTSGVLVKTVAQTEVVNEADMQFSGSYAISIPSDNQPHVVNGGCAVAHDFHVFTLWPHMHQIATHQTFSVTPMGSVTANMLLDTDYSFSDQKNYPMTDTIVHAGDRITTGCTYVNNTGSTVTFGESSTNEMCFTGIYRYPAGGNLFACVMGQSI
jgi:Copper type II ascorbate-dependent monooxygenase, C-terminal domain